MGIIKYKLIMGQDDHQFSRHHGGGAVCAIILFSLAAYYFYTYSALSDKNPDMFVQGNKLTCWADPAIALPKANFYISINDEAAPTGNYVNVSASFTEWMSYQFYICISMIVSTVLLVIYSASDSNLMLYASGILKGLTAIGCFINLIWILKPDRSRHDQRPSPQHRHIHEVVDDHASMHLPHRSLGRLLHLLRWNLCLLLS